ncbi:minor tail protein [Mycobacterium phage FF47]|uniref:DUF7257 domain-containing protein n=1 Tax=Mycobacterium phage FF47 TaxID=1305710 RepID=M4WNM7_9CAUD|nr:minor tail protein [Mycobacterium phage FF47]AGI12292.1 hypothetical protein FF47_24 [Mycobacterium phage FF47]
MSRAYDGQKQPVAEYDPQKQLQFALDKAVKELGSGLFDLVDLVFEAAKERIKEVVDTLIGTITDPNEMIDELRDWVENLPNLMDQAVQQLKDQLTGIVNSTPTDIDNWLLDLLTQNSPLPAANLFGRIQLPQFGGGVPLNALTTSVANELGPFTALTVPNQDGWSYNETEDAAQVICDGERKTLWVRGTPIKVEEDQAVNSSISVKYSDIVAGAGAKLIKYAFETYETEDGSGTATLVDIGGIDNPSGTLSTPVALSVVGWETPAGVQSIRPVLIVEDLVTEGTVFWKNTPSLTKPLLGILAGGLGAALQARIDEFNGLVQALLTNPGSVLGEIPNIIVEGIDNAQNLGEALAGIINNAVNGAGNLAGSGFGFGDLFEVFRDQQRQITELNEGLAALQADLGGQQNSGNSVVVKFNEYADGPVPASFDLVQSTGAGDVVVEAGMLEWQDSGNADATRFYIFQPVELMTDYFEVSMVMPRRPENELLGSNPCFTYLFGRSNAAGDTKCFARVGYSRMRMGCHVSGTETLFGPGDVSYGTPPGAYVTFRGGTIGGVRIFQILVNNQVRATATDTGNVSQLGDLYRRCGVGFHARARFGGQSTPGNVSIWTMNDNVPVEVTGTTFRAYRSLTATVTVPVGEVPLPSGVFDVVDYKSQDLAWDPTTNEITVNTAGTYMATARIEYNNVAGMGLTNWYHVWYVNGVIKGYGKPVKSVTVNGVGVPATSADSGIGGDPFIYYLAPGDVIRLGMGSNGSTAIKGESTGAYTNVTLTKIS